MRVFSITVLGFGVLEILGFDHLRFSKGFKVFGFRVLEVWGEGVRCCTNCDNDPLNTLNTFQTYGREEDVFYQAGHEKCMFYPEVFSCSENY